MKIINKTIKLETYTKLIIPHSIKVYIMLEKLAKGSMNHNTMTF